MNMENLVTTWKADLERELKDNILGFWMKYTLDKQHGGFLGEITPDLHVIEGAEKSLVLNTRILWTFSAAYRIYRNPEYLQMAERAYEYVTEHFLDSEYGGLFWMLSAEGTPTDDKKQVYGQAFAIYALTEYHRATGHEESLSLAIKLFHLLEKYSYDPQYKGYLEAHTRDWKVTDNLSLSDKDLNEKKSMNTHLHVMEAYTNLLRVWPSDELKVQLAELIEVTLDHIVDPITSHFKLFFNEEWQVKSDHISYGHDIEGSWLLLEAAEVLGNADLLERTKIVAIAMAEATYVEGIDPDGGILNEANAEGLIDTDKDWWPQAEAMVGFYNAFQMTDDVKYKQAALDSWSFIQKYIVDHEHGEWIWSVTREGVPNLEHSKVSPWKCPYHNGRACMEMLERL
ncbi:AGE family epimerase/isomerase [Paenibacillus crassostreae]|uniref:Cellobiose 2-epimerase n=1 Tax=Paenibacillus crassostreae TaxID=1763538 RepID=A0A167B6S0_9BACL|nr:AGE family epimerase/isomerase [Paenibacillus crassostreae]AOZ93122.1 N-acyl-D-glucosamine 2-epimerase [Paenibacillus crassostreae]OAB71789.1 N-acyl-D-glucosamine 2-epimerase [Paenibacillus crassostreae]